MRVRCPVPRSLSRRAGPVADEAGFSLIEATVALVIFAIVATALIGVLASAVTAHGLARERTLAKEHSLGQIEQIRRLPYDSVGTVAGNPSGTIVASQPVTVTGLQATMVTNVSYVNDPTPTSYATAANYKKVTVTVTRDRDAKQLIRSVTHIAPPARAPYGGINNAIINAQVVDYALSTPLENATVSLATGPSAPRSDVTDVTGTATFPALTPNPGSGAQMYYHVTAALSGYNTLPEDAPPGNAGQLVLAPAQTANTAIRLYRPATIYVTISNWTSGGTTDVSVGSARKAQEFTYSGGTLAITSLDGEPIIPGIAYTVGARKISGTTRQYVPSTSATVPSGYPTSLSTNFTTSLGAAITTRNITVQVRNGGSPVAGARVDIEGGPAPGYYLTDRSAANGNIAIRVPRGTGYTVKAWNAAGTGFGQALNVNANSNVTVTVNVP